MSDKSNLGAAGDGPEGADFMSLTCGLQYSTLALCTEIHFKYTMVVSERLNVEPSTGQDVLPIFDAGG